MALFLAAECSPFAVAAIILAALTAIELLCLLFGFSLGEAIGKAGMDGHNGVSGMLAWLNVGGVPVLVLVMLFLGLFAMSGFLLQGLAATVWSPLPVGAAALPAFVLSLPAVRISSRIVARLVPRDETYAVEPSAFIGLSGEVTVGPLDQGLPGRVRVKDQYGNWHSLRATAARGELPMAGGAQVLIVDHVSEVFIAVAFDIDTSTYASMEQP